VWKVVSNIMLKTPGRFEHKHLTPGDTGQKLGLKGTAKNMNMLVTWIAECRNSIRTTLDLQNHLDSTFLLQEENPVSMDSRNVAWSHYQTPLSPLGGVGRESCTHIHQIHMIYHLYKTNIFDYTIHYYTFALSTVSVSSSFGAPDTVAVPN